MISFVWDEDDSLIISADEQLWDKATLEELKENYGIVFMTAGDAVIPVLVRGDIIYLGSEDDGTIFFEKYGPDSFAHGFSKYWIPHLIADLLAARDFKFDKKG